MKILVTGAAGFVGSNISRFILEHSCDVEIFGFDNLSRAGSEINVKLVKEFGVRLIHGDARIQSDLDSMPAVDWVIDCAANPSALAGLDGPVSSRQVMEHNLLGTINLLEYCKKHKAGLILLSTSRVYSAKELAQLPMYEKEDSFQLEKDFSAKGISSRGISEDFPTSAPITLYGASKLASETLMSEYGEAFGFPIWINRCGVLGGAGQFGKADQGVFSYWIHSFREKRPLKYIGFGGSGHQVRDILHPKDLVHLLIKQMQESNSDAPKITNLGGGTKNSMSLKQLSAWSEERFGAIEVIGSTEERRMDAPWIVMDSSMAKEIWDWTPKTTLNEILEEIGKHAEANPQWLKTTN